MTKNTHTKIAVRARMAATGENYLTAYRALFEQTLDTSPLTGMNHAIDEDCQTGLLNCDDHRAQKSDASLVSTEDKKPKFSASMRIKFAKNSHTADVLLRGEAPNIKVIPNPVASPFQYN
jgi:hypothetical protein